jgi:hypothetical protein
MVVRTAPEPAATIERLESGVYVGTIRSITEVERPADMYHDKPYSQFEFLWEIEDETVEIDGEEVPRTIKSWFTISVNEKSNLSTKLLPALGLPPIKPGEQWDEDEWVGMSCQLQIEKFTKSDGNESNRIIGYMALPKRRAKAMF